LLLLLVLLLLLLLSAVAVAVATACYGTLTCWGRFVSLSYSTTNPTARRSRLSASPLESDLSHGWIL